MVRLLFTIGFTTVLSTAVLPQVQELRSVLVSASDAAGTEVLGLQADDFAIENGGATYGIIDVVPASYPLAIIVDTSSNARSDFQALRSATANFVEGLGPREVAVYTSGTPVSRAEAFTRNRVQIGETLARMFAAPSATTHALETLLQALEDTRRPTSTTMLGVIMLSAGGLEMNPPRVQQITAALSKRSTIVYIVEEEALRLDRGEPQAGNRDMFANISRRTSGQYIRGVGASVYRFGLDRIRRQLDAESVVSYAVRPGAFDAIRVRVRPPATTVRAIPMDREQ